MGRSKDLSGGVWLPPMIEAAKDIRYLVDRGYPKESAIRFVSDHYRLPEISRFVLYRVIVPTSTAQSRKRKAVPLHELRGARLLVDGYNVLIAVESLLGGRPVYRCDDGFLRDVQGIFKSYRVTDITASALSALFDLLASVGLSCLEVLLDQQISLSGQLAASMREMMKERRLSGTARTVRDVDCQLKASNEVVATGDGNIIDSLERVVDIPGEIAVLKSVEVLSL